MAGWKALKAELVDRRVQTMEVAGQDILTRDKVSLRVNLTALWQVEDAVKARGELQASAELRDAAKTLSESPASLQLRYLQTLLELGADQNSTVVFPIPMDIVRPFLEGSRSTPAVDGGGPGDSVPHIRRVKSDE